MGTDNKGSRLQDSILAPIERIIERRAAIEPKRVAIIIKTTFIMAVMSHCKAHRKVLAGKVNHCCQEQTSRKLDPWTTSGIKIKKNKRKTSSNLKFLLFREIEFIYDVINMSLFSQYIKEKEKRKDLHYFLS